MKTVYLAGPIFGMGDAYCNVWRDTVKEHLEPQGFTFLNPMDRDYRGQEQGNERAIVGQDKTELFDSDLVLVNAAQPSWGTAMEIAFAWSRAIPVISVVPVGKPVSPWLRYHSTVVESFQEAAALMGGTW